MDVEKGLLETGLSPIFNEQTPEVLPWTHTNSIEVMDFCNYLLFYAKFCPHLSLAGLAANQLQKNEKRINSNVCVIKNKGDWIIAINPMIIGLSGATFTSREGCLTWPKKEIIAIRHEIVQVSYYDLTGEPISLTADGFEAIVWQHEINHLSGIEENIADPECKINPNSKCECGSGQKFKKCCGR